MQIVWKDIRSIGEIPLEKPDYIEDGRWKNIQKLKSESDKKRSLASGYLLDYMCKDLEIEYPDYAYVQNGKPILKDRACAFNLSHSGDYVVIAYHKAKEPIGVDIQKVRPMREGMEKRILHEKETGKVNESVNERIHYMNCLWTIKESFVKMTGEGLSRDFRTVYVDFENGTVMAEDGSRAKFSIWEWEDDYFLSVCSNRKEECEINEI